MKNKIRIAFLIIFSLYSAYFFFGSVFAPILAHYQIYELSAKLTSLFIYSCHQQPDRSFWILGYPMALCCRCCGVYFATMLLSFISIFKQIKFNKYAIIAMILISAIDIYINYGIKIGAYNTGNITRFIVGILMGTLIVIVINKVFDIRRRN